MKKRFKKLGVVSDYLPWIIIAIAVLAILLVTMFLMREQGESLIDKIRSLFGG